MFGRALRLTAAKARYAAAASAPVALAVPSASCEANNSTYALAAGAALLGYTALSAHSTSAKCEAQNARLESLEVGAAKKSSSAFVFIKPHAVTEPVKALVKGGLEKAGMTVLREGLIPGSKIDADMLIDTHYGAIAAKAVKLKPAELSPSPKALKEFEAKFGLSWKDALAKGCVYNAADGCKKLGIDGDGLDAKWATLKRGETLIKFGGGFYCGKVDGIYIINGFYMAMRGKFTAPSAAIYYYVVEWPTAALKWEDFRGTVLGATNPAEAAPGSLRKQVLESWRSLGLAAEPDTGDNGVHASASPFEALSERINWCGASLETDTYGKGMLAAKIPKATILAWANDPQVALPEGGKGSLFDALEDMDSDACLDKAVKINEAN